MSFLHYFKSDSGHSVFENTLLQSVVAGSIFENVVFQNDSGTN